MKDKILNLRKQGKTYNEICEVLDCSKSLVSYYCGEGQKEKTRARQRELRKNNVLLKKVENFKQPNTNRRKRPKDFVPVTGNKQALRTKADDFQRRVGGHLGKRKIIFTYKDVLEHYGEETTCYLTGREINLKEPRTYSFDHIMPASRGGNNTFDNLGIACQGANKAKSDMTVDEFLGFCKEALEHNGYTVKKE